MPPRARTSQPRASQTRAPAPAPAPMYSNQLAQTGTGVLVVGGLTMAGWWIAAVALTAVVLGALCVRLAFRRGEGA
ncbi:hypothetical protein ACWC1D_16010 [Streptomyces sp. NPDC001478]